ncbi:MAG: PadR family transcriptional regulator [Spirulina sp. SIO3F2]|nr:PadR family transcriptional regulator [Spirulina sp. SIO3F2]
MALAHTILTLLSYSPASGYDISKRFEEDISCYWKASQQQIYRELGKMAKQGWVTHQSIPQAGKPDKKIYELTPVGETELLRWFAEPSEPTPIREDLLVKVLAGPYLPRDLLHQELKHRRHLHERQLSDYHAMEQCFLGASEPTSAEQFRYLTLRRGIRYEESWIDWCDEVMAVLAQMEN